MKRPTERIANWLHEASVLVAVFPILDKVIRNEMSLRWAFGTLMFSGLLFGLSVFVDVVSERRRS